jgi:CRISPR-associated protein Cas2
MNMIVAYDIANPRRLQKIAKVMKDYGRRAQKSIFEVETEETTFAQMRRRVEGIMDPAVDGVKYFPLCNRCADTLITIGLSASEQEEGDYLIL